MLHSVSTLTPRTAPADPANAFQDAVEHILNTNSAADALSEIVRLHQDATRGLESRLYVAESEATAAAAESRTRHTMLMQLHETAAHLLWGQARATAETGAAREVIEHVRMIAQRALSGSSLHATVGAGKILDALSHEPATPVHQPHITAFTPSDRFRAGQFSTAAGDITLVFTFIGYALVDHGPGTHGTLESVFLVDDQAMVQSRIEAERDVNLDGLLPSLHAA